MTTTRWALGLGLALLAGAATGAPIYRCGNTYSQTPCPEGGKLVEATDPRTAAQRAEARRFAAAERQAAADREREAKASAPPVQTAPATLSPAAVAPAASAAAKERGGRVGPRKAKADRQDKDFVAAAPREKTRRK